jgi:high-affinity Fe2+/Pb2+ permease
MGSLVREEPSRTYRAIRLVLLTVIGGAVGFLVARFLLPAVLERNTLFLILPFLLVATLLFARALRRGRSGS